MSELVVGGECEDSSPDELDSNISYQSKCDKKNRKCSATTLSTTHLQMTLFQLLMQLPMRQQMQMKIMKETSLTHP